MLPELGALPAGPCSVWSRGTGTGREKGQLSSSRPPYPRLRWRKCRLTHDANSKRPIPADSPSGAGLMDHRGSPLPTPLQSPVCAESSAQKWQSVSSLFIQRGPPGKPWGQHLFWPVPGPPEPGPAHREHPAPFPACTHISVMVSGRLAGMAVRPLPRQSTMPLLQAHMAGQEPEERVQEGTRPASPWPAETAACDLRVSSLPRLGRTGGDRVCLWMGMSQRRCPRTVM